MANPQSLKKNNGPSLINVNVIYKQLYLHVLYKNCLSLIIIGLFSKSLLQI